MFERFLIELQISCNVCRQLFHDSRVINVFLNVNMKIFRTCKHQNIATRLVFTIVLGIHCTFLFILPVQLKIFKSNACFIFTRPNKRNERVGRASGFGRRVLYQFDALLVQAFLIEMIYHLSQNVHDYIFPKSSKFYRPLLELSAFNISFYHYFSPEIFY